MSVAAPAGLPVDDARLEVVARAELPAADGWGRGRRLLGSGRPTHPEEVLATRAVPELVGPAPGGPVTARVGIDAVGAPTTVGRRLTLSTRLRLVVVAGGRRATAERTLFVRRRPPPPSGPRPTGVTLDGPAVVVVGPDGPGRPVDGPTRRPLGVRVLLLAGPDPVPAGRLEVGLVRHTRRSPPGVAAAPVLADDVVVRRRLDAPPLGAGASAELPVALEVPVLAAQTASTAAGSVAWSVVATWRTASGEVGGAADVVARVPGRY